MRGWVVLASLAVLRASALGAPVRTTGFDGVDSNTGTATDCLEMEEVLVGGAADADISVQTTTVHNASNGGSDSSKFSAKSAPATGKSAYYKWKTNLPAAPTSYGTGYSVNIDTAPSSGNRRAILCALENDATAGGCCLFIDNARKLTLAYVSGSDIRGGSPSACTSDADCSSVSGVCLGTTCRASWGTFDPVLTQNSCTTDRTIGCTVNGDCPNSGTCSGLYFAGLALNEFQQTGGDVICEAALAGRILTGGVTKNLGAFGAPVGQVVNFAYGVSEFGATTGAPVAYFDDAIVVNFADGELHAGHGYVARKVPSDTGAVLNWNQSNCGASVQDYECVDDYGLSSGSYLYESGLTTNNAVKVIKKSKVEEFAATTPSISLGQGELIDAVQVSAFGRTGDQKVIQQSILICPQAACDAGTCTNTGAGGASCTTYKDCCIPLTGAANALADDTSVHWLDSFLAKTPPTATQLSSWSTLVNALGQRVETTSATAGNATVHVGALLTYVHVKKPDQHEPLTLKDHNKGTDDGKVSIALIGDSTLQGTEQAACQGGTADGEPCVQDSYCSWDSPTEKDKPPGGCLQYGADADAKCKVCSSRHSYQCAVDGDCDLGNCSSGHCANDDTVTCVVNGDCNLGTCLSTSTCVNTCPGGVCPTEKVGWGIPIPQKVTAEAVLACGLGGEDMGQMFKFRFPVILDGKGTEGFPDTAVSDCRAISGVGTCSCTTGTVTADCGSGATCTNGLCVGGDTIKQNCGNVGDCNWQSGRFCQFPPPDYVVTLQGYNDELPYGLDADAGFMHDTECSTIHSIASGFPPPGLPLGSHNSPPKHCPQYGASPYGCTATACDENADCTGSAECYGRCANTDLGCVESSAGCTCTIDAPGCNSSSECTLDRTCRAPGSSLAVSMQPGGMYALGVCGCSGDANCPSGYSCVGNTNEKVCRLNCSADATCGSQSSCRTSPTPRVCMGRCACTCDNVSCTSDTDCGGTKITTRWGGFRSRFMRGKCNLATGKCGCCGLVRCPVEAIMARGCSCTTGTQATDCGSGGICTDGVCTSGDAGRVSCTADGGCASGRQCMRCGEQLEQYLRTYQGLHYEIATRMQGYVTGLNESTPPALLFSEIPLPHGRMLGGVISADRMCNEKAGDSDYYVDIGKRLAAGMFPARHVISQATFNAQRMSVGEHSDYLHYVSVGAAAIGEAVADTLNKLNVCLKNADGTPQRYCQKLNGTWTSTTCATSTGCASDENCNRRRCDGDEGNCPSAGDTCGAD